MPTRIDMPLVLEGPDGAGKTTLGNRLAMEGLSLFHSGGPPVDAVDLRERCLFVEAHRYDHVFDRIPHISERVYRRALDEVNVVPPHELEARLADTFEGQLVAVYCRPSLDRIMQAPVVVREHKPPEYAEKVRSRRLRIVQEYDRLLAEYSARGLIRLVYYDYEADPGAERLIDALTRAEVYVCVA